MALCQHHLWHWGANQVNSMKILSKTGKIRVFSRKSVEFLKETMGSLVISKKKQDTFLQSLTLELSQKRKSLESCYCYHLGNLKILSIPVRMKSQFPDM